MSGFQPYEGANEIVERLRAELAAHVNENEALGKQQGEFIETIVKLEKQRDDARRWLRDACAEIARIETRFYDTLTPQQIAERNGWNCFSQKEGGGA